MTTPALDTAGEQAAAELAKRLEHVVPSTFLADPAAFARQFIADAVAEGWRYVPPPVPIQQQTGRADPPNEEFRAAKAALTRKDHDRA
jgi:hypothetical protein